MLKAGNLAPTPQLPVQLYRVFPAGKTHHLTAQSWLSCPGLTGKRGQTTNPPVSTLLQGPLKSHVQEMRAANMDMLVPAHQHGHSLRHTMAALLHTQGRHAC